MVTNKSSLHINLSKTTIVDRKPILYHNQWEEESKEMQEGRRREEEVFFLGLLKNNI